MEALVGQNAELMIENLFSYMFAKNCQKRAKLDIVIAKIKWCSFLTHIVERPQSKSHASI